jgi:hypothetical protein
MRAHPLALIPQRFIAVVLVGILFALVSLYSDCCRSHADTDREDRIDEPVSHQGQWIGVTELARIGQITC